MTLFGDLKIAGSGLFVYRKWMDALSDNIANINTVRGFDEPAFQERFVQAQSTDVAGTGGGVKVGSIAYGSAEGRLRFDPDNPLANEDGYVRGPDMDLADQMTNMILAQRGYQANLASIERARNAYEAALGLGK
jgi:flagellar basal-body rod protein FlgC